MSKKEKVEQEMPSLLSERGRELSMAIWRQQKGYISGADPYMEIQEPDWLRHRLGVEAILEEVPVAVIHKDFRSVADKLPEEVKEIIDEAKPDDRVVRYKRLGFGGIARVKDYDIAHEKKEKREKLLNLINDYKVRYPLCQFIDSKSLDELCKKYGLVYAPAEYFNQEIPEENLRELEGFKLDEKDSVREFWSYPVGGGTSTTTKRKLAVQLVGVTHHPSNVGFKVVATKDMFDVPLGFEFRGSTLRAQVKDPIVLKEVAEGFLIVTAWGPEAELPELNLDKQ